MEMRPDLGRWPAHSNSKNQGEAEVARNSSSRHCQNLPDETITRLWQTITWLWQTITRLWQTITRHGCEGQHSLTVRPACDMKVLMIPEAANHCRNIFAAWLAAGLLLSAPRAQAQVNDYFANRMRLTGIDVTVE